MRLRHKPLLVMLVATTATCGIAATALSAIAFSSGDRTLPNHRTYKPKPHWPKPTTTPTKVSPSPTPRPSTPAPTSTAPSSTPTTTSTPPPSTPAPTQSTQPTQPTPTGPVSGNPVAMTNGLYVDPYSEPRYWVASHSTDTRAPAIKSGIADIPMGRWYNGDSGDASDARSYVSAAATAGKLPVLVAYHLPDVGGAADAAGYRAWVDSLVAAVADRPAVVVLEPDALPALGDLGSADQSTRLDLLGYAVDRFAAAAPNTWTYLDAGHDDWTPAATMAQRLRAAHVGKARGFSLNVSNYQSTARNVSYAQAVDAALGSDSHYVIDISRNGNPLNGDDWCNPIGERLGGRPGADGTGGLDLRLWVKPPGESDGNCGLGRGTYAGQFSPELAMTLLGR